MKRLFLIGVMVLTAVAGFAQSGERIDTLKERQKVLKITTKLNKLQLDYEKEKANNIELSKKAADINVEANIATTEFNTTNASSTVKDAKTTIKRLKEAKSINKKLAKSQKTLTRWRRRLLSFRQRLMTVTNASSLLTINIVKNIIENKGRTFCASSLISGSSTDNYLLRPQKLIPMLEIHYFTL